MADLKISDLTAVVSVADTDEIPINQAGTNYKMTVTQLEGHLNADNIQFLSATGGIVATNIGDALRELQDEILALDADSVAFAGTVTGDIEATNVGDAIRELGDEKQQIGDPVLLPEYTVAGVPSASDWVRGMIYVNDETGGAVPAFSDGVDWRRVTDRSIVS